MTEEAVARLIAAAYAYKRAADSDGPQRADWMRARCVDLRAAACAMPDGEMAVYYEVADEDVG